MDPLTLVMLAVLALLVFFMFRNGRKRQKDTLALQSQMVAGADVMTNFGLYGTIVSIDEEANKVALEIAPGTIVQIHRQTIARVVEPTVADDDLDETPVEDDTTAAITGEPEYGQRTAEEPSTDQVQADTNTEPKKGDA
ncbi:preprotein translocase subunit YajC [Cryobacterium arcticum]|uniref:Preprotein translocase subunit YajC n=1 Tax=Cryobacterium arcticum TaxID=670052 RepID=A0A317ZSJ4_9MICO|nr:preprotein translocase subunit YajC [Cryobacterium arcticum]PXA67725.1 preprotein translocase subunit YajC [Cryobacterium arcticum]